MHRGLGQTDPDGDLGHAEARRPGAEGAEDLGRSLYRLDHSAPSATEQRSGYATSSAGTVSFVIVSWSTGLTAGAARLAPRVSGTVTIIAAGGPTATR
jgi:hypothetical protein